MLANTVILPVRLDSYAGDKSALDAHFYGSEDEFGSKSAPEGSIWIAVHIVNGKIDHSLTEYGYQSLEDILKTHKKDKIAGLRENGKDAGLEEARAIAEDALGVVISEDQVLLHVEGELNLPDGALLKAFRTLQKARKGGGGKPKKRIDREEVFYSLSNEDIIEAAKLLHIPQKRLTPEVVKNIHKKVNDSLGSSYDTITDCMREALEEAKEAAT